MTVGLDALHKLTDLWSVIGPQPRPGLDGVDPPGDVLQAHGVVLRLSSLLGVQDSTENARDRRRMPQMDVSVLLY